MTKAVTTGMVLGKFLPPHLGHQYLIDFARHYVDQLTLVVGTLEQEPIPGALRFDWMRELYEGTGVRVVHLDKELPQAPEEHEDFWKIWEDSLRPLLPQSLDYVFASEDYGWKLAEVLDATFVPVNILRSAIPVSGTAIRDQPLQNWQYLPRPVRSYFAKRVCIFGPESTGKSTLTNDLAAHFQTIAVPEYARILIESQNCELNPTDMIRIARGQASSEDALAASANRLLFCDTDLLATKIWSEWLFETCDPWIRAEASLRQYDLTLLTDVDVPWVADSVRFLPNDRTNFFLRCKAELESHNRRYVILRGTWEERRAQAIAAVLEIL